MSSFDNPSFNFYYSALPLPILKDIRLNDRDRRLLAALYFFAGKSKNVYNKTRKELGHCAGGMTENVVTFISSRLVKLGWLKKSGDGGKSQSAAYELTVPDTFTHLQRPIKQTCNVKTTQKSDLQSPLEKRFTTTVMSPTSQKEPLNTQKSILFSQNQHYPLSSSLIYPKDLDSTFANSLLTTLPESQQQIALDKWIGQVNSYKTRYIPIHSPGGLFRSVVKGILAGQASQHASLVKQQRERTAVVAKITEQAKTPPISNAPSQAIQKRFAPGELKEKLLAAIKQQRPKSDQNPTTSPKKTHHNLVSV